MYTKSTTYLTPPNQPYRATGRTTSAAATMMINRNFFSKGALRISEFQFKFVIPCTKLEEFKPWIFFFLNRCYNMLINLYIQELQLDKFVMHEVDFEDINKAFDLLIGGKSLQCVIWMNKNK
ncbi:hypothetical protein OSB04_017901 [Centaurea solstitialis]|uniref:Alcohol dehydrogenase n=1 Tax=Centaurea solstitialis TaxID=347529 RepID=A0AA38TEQ1_9ASTR|nr:hypothetical protein OSB04_017901 [Centaurea solstitialis]